MVPMEKAGLRETNKKKKKQSYVSTAKQIFQAAEQV